ncbi:MAG: 1-acyl-sn-glycerol-3-phosphate acyltransferase [Lachnospiraceae bacterium]|jgi:1-acyl-sn-glycerol-3-phosphate acyltransferase|nr:1-acyl-sn-glycerol-3-phosphate acyltransferase [Lachnospiraceae bacterium]
MAKGNKKTLQEQLLERSINRPNAIIYRLLVFFVIKLGFKKKYNVHFDYRIDPKKLKPPFIVVSNHASRMDYVYTSLAFLPHRLNYVVGNNEFFRSHLTFILRLMQAIPKKNFVNDTYAMRQMLRVIKKKGVLCLFPEGMSSISGANQPSAIGTGKVLKMFDCPIYMTKISGGYLTSTKHCLDERPGRVDVEVDKLFSREDLKKMTGEEIQKALDEAIWHDDYEWNKSARVEYAGKGQMAKNLQDMLYYCPQCKTELTMETKGNLIYCKKCKKGAELNNYYDLVPYGEESVIPETPRAWWNLQRHEAKVIVSDPNFELREHVRLGVIPKYSYLKNNDTSEICGEGELVLNKEGLHFDGTREGKPFKFSIKPKSLPTYGMCTDMSRFYTFATGEFLEFYPSTRSVAKWLLCTEENHRNAGGMWNA